MNKMKRPNDNVFKRSLTFIRESKKEKSSEMPDTKEVSKLVEAMSLNPESTKHRSHKLAVVRDENGLSVSKKTKFS